MKIQLSDHFTYGRLLRFTLPSIVMMIFTSIYSVVDGMFVSNIVGANALSSINIIMPPQAPNTPHTRPTAAPSAALIHTRRLPAPEPLP